MTLKPDTVAVHAGRDDLTALGVHVPPIDLSTTYPLPDVELGGQSYETLATGGRPGQGQSLVYQRLWNPTVARFESALAELETCDEAVAFASGMAALSACLLATVAAGKPHVVAIRPLYGGSDHVLATGLLGTRVTWSTVEDIAGSIEPDTGLVIVETPANPTLELVDLSAVCSAAGEVPVLVDNTFATPVLQQPVRHGATLVLHSATKYLGGHGDIIGGVVAATGDWAIRLRQIRALTGGLLHPLAGYELHRGLQTLPVRVRAQQTGAGKVAGWLGTHSMVELVHYPGLAECDPSGLVGRQMSGPGSVLAFTVASGGNGSAQHPYDAAVRVAGATHLFTHAVSLGGVDSLIQHPASLTHRPVAVEAKPGAGVVRVSIGLEDPDDLIADLAQAFVTLG